ncbi:MAG: SLC13 family permease [Enterobacterales bacterium]|nr:SLC13 family permease [Enterobacterales bacterium]
MQSLKKHTLWLGPLISLVITFFLALNGQSNSITLVIAVTSLCAIWWIFEPIPIPITSLIPLALFSLTGVLSSSQVAQAYGHPLILLLLGGFILSQSMAYSGAHRRIALLMVNLFGANSARSLVLGFMVAAALLSMWVSNTATTLMLLPVALATLEDNKDPKLTIALLLGIAYAANIGGIGTPIGTPPNALFMSGYSEATGIPLGFLDWMKWGVPVVILFIPCAMLWITKGLKQQISIKLPSVGQWTTPEIRVLMVFAVTALLWITRKQPFGGWSEWTGLTSANDASVALLACIALFIIPSGATEKSETNLSNDKHQPSSDNASGRLL